MEEIRMPKNVRQIGRAVQGNEIYVEDYVITFARKQANKKTEPQLAVLLGKERKSQTEPLFISGAVLVEDFPMESTLLMSNENWSQVYEGIKTYFSELEILGCLFIRSTAGEEITERIRRLHKENFDGEHKVLFLYDGEEKEESFYISDGAVLRKQEGFYIYYEKNEAMQEYMIHKSEGASEEPLFDDKAMKRVRETIAAKPGKGHTVERKMLQLMYGASTVLAAAVLVIGVTTLESHDKMQTMETTLNRISDTVSEATEAPVMVETLVGNTEKEKSSNEEMKETLSRQEEKKPTYYTVKAGDTLASISMKKYHTLEMIEKIQELNAIDDKDKIYAGEKILLP